MKIHIYNLITDKETVINVPDDKASQNLSKYNSLDFLIEEVTSPEFVGLTVQNKKGKSVVIEEIETLKSYLDRRDRKFWRGPNLKNLKSTPILFEGQLVGEATVLEVPNSNINWKVSG